MTVQGHQQGILRYPELVLVGMLQSIVHKVMLRGDAPCNGETFHRHLWIYRHINNRVVCKCENYSTCTREYSKLGNSFAYS